MNRTLEELYQDYRDASTAAYAAWGAADAWDDTDAWGDTDYAAADIAVRAARAVADTAFKLWQDKLKEGTK